VIREWIFLWKAVLLRICTARGQLVERIDREKRRTRELRNREVEKVRQALQLSVSADTPPAECSTERGTNRVWPGQHMTAVLLRATARAFHHHIIRDDMRLLTYSRDA
jgi:hypothetical protein